MFTQYAPIAKLVVAVTANLGIAKIVGDVVRNNVVVTSTMQAVTVKAGTLVVTSLICEKTTQHITETVDLVADWLDKKKEVVEEELAEMGLEEKPEDDPNDEEDRIRLS